MSKHEDIWNELPLEYIGGIGDRLRNVLVSTLVNYAPRGLTRGALCRSSGPICQYGLSRPGSYQLLNALYDFHDLGPIDAIDRAMGDCVAARAVRNRFLFVREALFRMGVDALNRDGQATFVSIGSGDVNVETHAIQRLVQQVKGDVFMLAIDKDPQAITDGKKRAEQRNVQHVSLFIESCPVFDSRFDISCYVDMARKHFGKPITPNIIVNVGINEYLDLDPVLHGQPSGQKEIFSLLRAYCAALSDGGRLLSTNTDFHDRIPFLEGTLDWYCSYRDLRTLAGLIEAVGFTVEHAAYDPTKRTSIVIAVK